MKGVIKINNMEIMGQPSAPYKIKKKKRIVKISLWLATFLLGAMVIFLSAVPPVIMKDMVNQHVDFKKVYSAEDFGISSEKIILTTTDGFDIAAHEVFAENPKAVVIFISGIHNPSVTSFFGHAKMLQENGYASILYEMRAHGESSGDVICFGYKEYLDTKAVVDYIRANKKYNEIPIVVYGVSMGGATAINSIGEIEDIDGLISMSAYSSCEDVFYDNMINMGAPKIYAQIQKPFVKIYTAFKYGFESFGIYPKNEIMKLGDRPALIIHSEDDSQVPFINYQRIMKNAPEHVESWVREGDLHFIAKDEEAFFNPKMDKEYMDRILSFLNKHY